MAFPRILYTRLAGIGLGWVVFASDLFAQDLDPRAYIRIPVNTNTIISGFVYSYGSVLTDPTVPLKDLEADAQAVSVGAARSFNFLGLTSQALVALPYSWLQGQATVNGVVNKGTRAGFSDMRLRWSVLLLGAPAMTLAEMRKAPPKRKTILGASINVVAPTGEWLNDKLINLGTNRWSFRPELAISQPIGKHWDLDVYAGVWFFTDNTAFYPGNAVRSQEPMGAFQGHLCYSFKPALWVALDATFYTGGNSSINGKVNDDRMENSRIGLTAVVPTGKMNSLKMSASTGAIVRVGQDFTTFSLGWQHSWLHGMKKKK